jgi:inosine-5'-monophosphate dehydrogenase
MEYTMPTKAADFVEGGDGYDLETLFSKVNQGVTCTYDDLIFMPGMESDWSVCVRMTFCDRLLRRKLLKR